MAQKPSQKKMGVAKKEDGFDRLARMMKEGFDDVETNLRKEIHASENTLRKEIHESEGILRKEMREIEENLQYRISKVATDIYKHLDTSTEPQIQNHERRIKRLEDASKV